MRARACWGWSEGAGRWLEERRKGRHKCGGWVLSFWVFWAYNALFNKYRGTWRCRIQPVHDTRAVESQFMFLKVQNGSSTACGKVHSAWHGRLRLGRERLELGLSHHICFVFLVEELRAELGLLFGPRQIFRFNSSTPCAGRPIFA